MSLCYYVRSTDGCDETFDVYQDAELLASVPFWDDEAEAEAEARWLVAFFTLITRILA